MEKDIKLKLRLSRMDRSLLVAVPVTMILVFFALLAMLSAYQREAVVSTVRVSHTLAANQRNQLDVYLVGRFSLSITTGRAGIRSRTAARTGTRQGSPSSKISRRTMTS